ncbi:putative FAD synthetase [Candidatus Sulfopaludibacter sp. SbA3]|nr:putative FAD synthetase [Candidatus Sulfopaludibacter sp. SbA3]
MKIYRDLEETPPDFGPSALTIGNFDGVHFGHRRILRRLKAIADKHGWKASVLTFDPHPPRVVAPERTPLLMTSPTRRAELMEEEGIEQVLILPFTRELAMLSPEQFVEQLLVGRLGVKVVLVGDNFRFGHKQAGNIRVLVELGKRFGFETEIVPAVAWRGRVVSSSGIREFILAGRVSLAARLLQHAYGVEGEIVSGRGVGSRETVRERARRGIARDGAHAEPGHSGRADSGARCLRNAHARSGGRARVEQRDERRVPAHVRQQRPTEHRDVPAGSSGRRKAAPHSSGVSVAVAR